jgi:hypothetical protein
MFRFSDFAMTDLWPVAPGPDEGFKIRTTDFSYPSRPVVLSGRLGVLSVDRSVAARS